MEIGILGLTFHSGNKGCEALSYSFLEFVNAIGKKHNEIIQVDFITVFPTKKWIKAGMMRKKLESLYFPIVRYSNLRFVLKFYIYKFRKVHFVDNIRACTFVIDYTAGDSFTDLYGENRFYSRTFVKKKIIDSGIPFVLGSQTIGPFSDKRVEKLAVDVIIKSHEVYVRDIQSFHYTKTISGREPILTSDIAFALPYYEVYLKNSEKKKVGLNPSGLLWNGGYTKNNQFGLAVDYKEYCKGIIGNFLKSGYEVYLIPHAFSIDNYSAENDYLVALELQREFPACYILSDIKTPMEAKSYIAKMDLFIGARMHATIAAFSAGTPVIPFSYSRKFEGLFESLGYNFVIHGRTESTKDAICKTIEFAIRDQELKKVLEEKRIIIEMSNRLIESELERLIYGKALDKT